MDDTQQRGQMMRQLEVLERELASLRAQLRPAPVAPLREAQSVVLLDVNQSCYALPTSAIHQLIPLVAWRTLPDSPSWVLGVFRFRGETLVLVDLHRRLHQGKVSSSISISMVIVVTRGPRPAGLLVSSVEGVQRVEPHEVTAPPTDLSHAPFIRGSLTSAQGEIVHILSAARLCDELVLTPRALRSLESERPE